MPSAYMTSRLRPNRQPLQPLEVVLYGRQFMPVAGPAGLITAYLTSRTSQVMIVILYIVREQIASGVSC
jgi:hypothetical protein